MNCGMWCDEVGVRVERPTVRVRNSSRRHRTVMKSLPLSTICCVMPVRLVQKEVRVGLMTGLM